ncbi:putative cytochrome P450 [Medicago truncatula]|uniref:Cytochrome P450 family protein n=2 Tax=Medicago truncatula TaxID=3880 RepID=A0A072V8D1_MEDTR|nr:cytochrome P450 CYP82D47 [Medicago truncatula]KEH37856.1 cytochrome P450 family protein [Medicago truncatula]RHN74004.1 putative cytochrome P450 [Medicago truncatula]
MDVTIEYLYAVVTGVICIVLISYSAFFRGDARAQPKLPPLASGGWPLIGHLHLLGSSNQPPYITLGDLADKYGPIFTLRVGVHNAVVVSTWELAKEIFTTHDVIISSRPKFTAAKILGHDYANFGFSPYGDYWQMMRKVTASELLSTRRFETLRDIRDSEVKKSLMELCKSGFDHELGDLKVEMKRFLGDMNLNVIMRMIAGKRYSNESGDEREVRKVRWVFREFFRLTGLFVVGDAIPFLGWLDLGGHVKEMKKAAREMDSVVCGWLEDHRNKNDVGETKMEQDFIDVLLSVLHGVHLDGYDVDTVIKATCLTLIAGATDTTTVTITWALSLLLNNRHTLKKIQDELDEKVGKDRLVNESDINNLVYLQAVVKETLRLYPAGPLSGARQFTENCTVGGYNIQAGTRLILNLWKMHRDPRVWSKPLEFQPERFLNTHKDVDVKGQHYELLPFGGGRRSCPGITFGLQMTNLALASFLQAFEVTTPSNAQVDMSATFGLTNIKTTPLEVIAKPRLPYHLLFVKEH